MKPGVNLNAMKGSFVSHYTSHLLCNYQPTLHNKTFNDDVFKFSPIVIKHNKSCTNSYLLKRKTFGVHVM